MPKIWINNSIFVCLKALKRSNKAENDNEFRKVVPCRSVLYSVTIRFHAQSLVQAEVKSMASTTSQFRLFTQFRTSLPKVIWEKGRVAAAVPGAGWHKGLRIRNVCIVLVKDRCANVRYFSVRKQE